jgi:hypothetical protein
MLDAERETVRTLADAPWLPLGGLVAALAWLLAHAVAAAPVMLVTLPRGTQPAFAMPLAGVLSVAVLPTALSGLYAVVRAAREADGRLSLETTLRTYADGVRRHARDLTVATVVYRLAAAVPATVAFVVLLAGDTVATYAQYATGDGPYFDGTAELLLAWLMLTVAGAVGRLVLVFYDLPVVFAGVSPRHCWRAAWRVTRRRPRAVLRYGAGRLLLWSPMVVVVALEARVVTGEGQPLAAAANLGWFLVGGLVIGAVVATLLAAYHVVTYERVAEPVLREPTATGSGAVEGPESALVATPADDDEGRGRSRRTVAVWALAALVVVAAAGATGAVRTTDARPMPATERPVPEDATAADVLGTSDRVLANASYRARMTVDRTNLSTGDTHRIWAMTMAVDRRNRRARLDSRIRDEPGEPWMETRIYASETRTALYGYGDSVGGSRGGRLRSSLVLRRAGNWAVIGVPGYETLGGSFGGSPLDEAHQQNLSVVERTDDRIVLAGTHRPDDEGDLVSERVRMVVDPETGRPRNLTVQRRFRVTEDGEVTERFRWVETWTFSGYDDPGVEPPAAIGPRGPVEWLWDVVGY